MHSSIRRFSQAGSGRILLETPRMKRHYSFFALGLAIALCGNSLMAQQNAPDPFSGLTTIPFSLLMGAGTAQLQISDIFGNVLALIPLSGNGKNTVTADVSGYAAGTYLYSLIVDGKLVGTKKMIAL
jgi:hypothetical protein